jgi:hypothetical protein
MNVKAVCKAEDMQRSEDRQQSDQQNRLPQYRHQRCHSGGKDEGGATVGLQSSSTVRCRLKASFVVSAVDVKAVCKAEKQKTDQQSDQQNRLPSVSTPTRCHSEAKATEEAIQSAAR